MLRPWVDKCPFDKTNPHLYIFGQRINVYYPENKGKFDSNEEGKYFHIFIRFNMKYIRPFLYVCL